MGGRAPGRPFSDEGLVPRSGPEARAEERAELPGGSQEDGTRGRRPAPGGWLRRELWGRQGVLTRPRAPRTEMLARGQLGAAGVCVCAAPESDDRFCPQRGSRRGRTWLQPQGDSGLKLCPRGGLPLPVSPGAAPLPSSRVG